MKVTVTFRHQDSDEKLQDYVNQKISKLAKYFHRPMETNVVFSVEKFRHRAEITITADQTTFTGRETAGDAMSAFDLCLKVIEIQARRYRDRMKHRRSREEDASVPALAEYAEDSNSSAEPRIIKSDRYVKKPLSLEDAILLLKENHDDFLVFRDADSEKVSVLYRRRDGNFGLIEPD
jgi:putative sigma-54 modulation protein